VRPLAQSRPKKIALIGATGYEYDSPEARIDCFLWNSLRKVTNLADYEVVILDLLSLSNTELLDSAAFRKALDARTGSLLTRDNIRAPMAARRSRHDQTLARRSRSRPA
jgi:hypothetical protein